MRPAVVRLARREGGAAEHADPDARRAGRRARPREAGRRAGGAGARSRSGPGAGPTAGPAPRGPPGHDAGQRARARRALGGAVTNSQLFTAILNSNVIDVVLLANSQHEEQRYLSMCSIAARDQEVLSRAGTLAGLVVLGRRIVQGVLDDAQARQAALAGQVSHQHTNLFALANARANKSMTVLDEIEDAALRLVAAATAMWMPTAPWWRAGARRCSGARPSSSCPPRPARPSRS